MSDINKPTELYDPNRHSTFGQSSQSYNQSPSQDRFAESSQGRQKTEVLRPRGPKIIAMLVGVEGAPGIDSQIFRLDVFEGTTIGRDYTCDIVIDEPAVSRLHARVKLDEVERGQYRFFIQDLATENGTVVNGEKIIKHYLTEDDRVTLGRATLVFKLVDATQAG